MAPFRKVTAHVEAHSRPLYACSFNPYSSPEHPIYLAAAGINEVSIYEFQSETEVTPRLVINDPSLSLFEDNSGDGTRPAVAKTNRIYALNWLFDERDQTLMVAFGGEHATIRIVDANSGREVQFHAGHGNVVNEIRVHPSVFTVYASACKDMTIRIWSSRCPTALTVIAGLEGHRDQILSCDWSECGGYVASGSMDHTVRLWKVTDLMQSRIDDVARLEYQHGEDDGDGLPAPPDHVNSQNDTTYSSTQAAVTNDLHENYVDCVRFFDDFLITKSSDNVIMISKFGDFEEGVAGCFEQTNTKETSITQLATLNLPDGDTWFLKFDVDPMKEWLLCGVRTGRVHAWRLTPERLPSPNADHTMNLSEGQYGKTIRQIAFEPHGRLIACVADDASITFMKRVVIKQEEAS